MSPQIASTLKLYLNVKAENGILRETRLEGEKVRIGLQFFQSSPFRLHESRLSGVNGGDEIVQKQYHFLAP